MAQKGKPASKPPSARQSDGRSAANSKTTAAAAPQTPGGGQPGAGAPESQGSPGNPDAGATPPRDQTQAAAAVGPVAAARAEDPAELLKMIGRGVVPPIMNDPKQRKLMGLPDNDTEPGDYMVELNILYKGGLEVAAEKFGELWDKTFDDSDRPTQQPINVSKSYFQVRLSVKQWRTLLQFDATREPELRLIYKLWPDFKVKALVDRSIPTVKADAAFRAYSATGQGITWAVIDSGIDASHPHFGNVSDPDRSVIYHRNVNDLHRDFTVRDETGGASGDRTASRARALQDGLGHGTHVAGIIAGGLPKDAIQSAGPPGDAIPAAAVPQDGKLRYAIYEQVFEANPDGQRIWDKMPVQRTIPDPEAMHGVAPRCTLVSLKVLDAAGDGRVSDIMAALAYIREKLNDDPKVLRVHGVNLSIGYDFDAQMFACGQSPLCVEVDRLVRSGVVVVAAAGNTGYGSVNAAQREARVGLSNTINDPGNASLAITVGSTHRDSPHTFGVSFFSSKGPTGDGRLKPDLVAPGERITSCASPGKCQQLGIPVENGVAVYVDDSGTSMAAPHVSGAIAAFLSIRREFIQRPEEVKRIFLESATSLGRERYFEGHGLVDLMRAIQSV
jgi:serine protease AprX